MHKLNKLQCYRLIILITNSRTACPRLDNSTPIISTIPEMQTVTTDLMNNPKILSIPILSHALIDNRTAIMAQIAK